MLPVPPAPLTLFPNLVLLQILPFHSALFKIICVLVLLLVLPLPPAPLELLPWGLEGLGELPGEGL